MRELGSDKYRGRAIETVGLGERERERPETETETEHTQDSIKRARSRKSFYPYSSTTSNKETPLGSRRGHQSKRGAGRSGAKRGEARGTGAGNRSSSKDKG